MNLVEIQPLADPIQTEPLEPLHQKDEQELPIYSKDVQALDLSNISKDRFDCGDSQEEISSKDTDLNDDITRAEDNSSQSPSICTRKESNSLKGSLLTDFEIVPLAQARSRRPNKKPVDTYSEKVKLEEEKRKERLQKTVSNKQPKMVKLEENEEAQMEEEFPDQPTLRTGLGFQWRDWQLNFNHGLEALNAEEFQNFIDIVQEYKPECLSYENGHLELKVTTAKIEPKLTNKKISKTYQMTLQARAYMEFFGYIEKIKGKNSIKKYKVKKPVKTKK